MSNKTIAKFLGFVIPAVAVSFLLQACAFVSSDAGPVPVPSRYSDPEITGRIKSPDVVESSGIAASRCQSDVFWTHNDSGDEALIYAFNRVGDHLGTWRIVNAENKDWEDIATWKDRSGKCFIFIGEIGDNKLLRPEHIIYRVPEPLLTSGASVPPNREPAYINETEIVQYVYPDGDKNAETLMVHPGSGDIYVLTKSESGPSSVYRIKNTPQSENQTAEKVAEIAVPAIPNGLLTGGDISPGGRSAVVCDYRQAYELDLPDASIDFNEIWNQKPKAIDLGKRKVGESICFGVDGTEIFATSEGPTPPIIVVRRLN